MKTRRDTQGTWNITAYLGLILFAAIVFMGTKVEAQSWYQEPAVYAPVELQDEVEYALWSIRQRTGKSGYYAGATSLNVISNAVTVRYVSTAYFQTRTACDCSAWAQWGITWDGDMGHGEVLIKNDIGLAGKELQWVVLHELGHTFGGDIHHSGEGVFKAMHRTYPYNYALTIDDVLELPYSNRSLCHAELTTENDIYLPDADGNAVHLKYAGNYTWILASITASSNQGCGNVEVDSQGVVTIQDVRSISGNLSTAVLAPIADNAWTLQWAE